MNTSFIISADGCRIAYDVVGDGAPVILLHGGGLGIVDRKSWHQAGYVEQLKKHGYKVISIDIRGMGESDKPLQPSDYKIENHCRDILSVADACGVEKFSIWGFSYGGNIGRYLATQSARVSKFIMIGIPFGSAAPGEFRQEIIDLRDHWLPILKSQAKGSLDVQSLSQEDQEMLQHENVPVLVAWLSAMLDWESIEPENLYCSTLWLVGSKNDFAMNSIKEYEESLKTLDVEVQVVDGLDHLQEFTEINKVLPIMLSFMQT